MQFKKFFIPIFIFVLFNFYVILSFGYYHDDWGFFVFNDQTFIDHSEDIWQTEGILLHRYINVPFYILGSLMPNSELLYTYTFLIGCIIYFQIFDIIKNILKSKNISDYLSYFGLSLLIVCWYFFPFNISGQFWATNIHVKISFFFFLLHFQFLIKNKIYISILFLFISLSSYEMFYLTYLPLSYLIYKFKLIDINLYKKYLLYTSLIQIYFLLDRIFLLPDQARPNAQTPELMDLFLNNIENLFRFFWSIYMSYISILSITFQFLLFLPIIYFLLTIKKVKNFYQILLIFITSFLLNSAIVAGGGYGYTGNGIFSKTFYYASFFIFLFFLLIFLFQKSDFRKIIFLIYISLISFFGFYFESKSWITSWNYQKEIYKSDKILDIENGNKNLIIFFGPCKYNGVEIFYAPWDLTRSIREFNKKAVNDYVPLTNWKIDFYRNNKDDNIWLGLHNKHYEYPLINYDKVFLWDYFQNKILTIGDESKINFSSQDLYELNSYRDCELTTKKYKKNKIDVKQVKVNFYNRFN